MITGINNSYPSQFKKAKSQSFGSIATFKNVPTESIRGNAPLETILKAISNLRKNGIDYIANLNNKTDEGFIAVAAKDDKMLLDFLEDFRYFPKLEGKMKNVDVFNDAPYKEKFKLTGKHSISEPTDQSEKLLKKEQKAVWEILKSLE